MARLTLYWLHRAGLLTFSRKASCLPLLFCPKAPGIRLTSLLGAEQALAEHGAHVIIASRSLDRTQKAAQMIMVCSFCVCIHSALQKQPHPCLVGGGGGGPRALSAQGGCCLYASCASYACVHGAL